MKTRHFLAAAALCLTARAVSAAPVILEPGWTLIRTISFADAQAAHFNPADGLIYLCRRTGGSGDGLFRVTRYGYVEKIVSAATPAAVAIDPVSGAAFVAEDYGGYIYRTALGAHDRQLWVSGLHTGDDDPIGMAFAPSGYAGPVLVPGDALVVDRGYNGPDEIWRWSPVTPEGETAIHADDGTLVDAVDVAISTAGVYVADTGDAGPGRLFVLQPDSSLAQLSLSATLAHPVGLALDAVTGDLLVLDQAAGKLVRVVPGTGAVSDVVGGLSLAGDNWAGVDAAADGRQILVTEDSAGEDAVYVLARCEAEGSPELDCDGNGVADFCDIALGTHTDCDGNGVPDLCDIAGGAADCNADGVPDRCPLCPPVELVFVMDTSTSMDDEAAVLCATMTQIVSYLAGNLIDVRPTMWGIGDNPGGAYGCLGSNVVAQLGVAVPGDPPAAVDTLGACPGGDQVVQEDWALGTAVVAGRYPWQAAGTSLRLIVPLSDEGPWCGDPVTVTDEQAIDQAILVARANDVIVSPITGSGSSAAVVALAQLLADQTGGTHFASSVPGQDLAEGILGVIMAACSGAWDCNNNGVPDGCDIAQGTSPDLDGNGIPDECDLVGVPEGGPPEARGFGLGSRPNPFNPSTTITFRLAAAQEVSLEIFSLDGRRAAVLWRGALSAGPHALAWDGRDERGRALPSGVYLCRLVAGGRSETARLVMIR